MAIRASRVAHSDPQYPHLVHMPREDKLPYDDDPNNWTARLRPPGSFAKNALRPILGKDDPRSEPGGYP